MRNSNDDPFGDDILQPLPIDRFIEYRNVCMSRFPEALRAHHLLLLQERWHKVFTLPVNREISPRCVYTFYVPKNGNIENCTFIAIAESAIHEDVST